MLPSRHVSPVATIEIADPMAEFERIPVPVA